MSPESASSQNLIAEIDRLEASLKAAIVRLALIVRFREDINKAGVEGYVDHVPAPLLDALRVQDRAIRESCIKLEKSIAIAQAVLERDWRKANGMSPMKPEVSIATPSATTAGRPHNATTTTTTTTTSVTGSAPTPAAISSTPAPSSTSSSTVALPNIPLAQTPSVGTNDIQIDATTSPAFNTANISTSPIDTFNNATPGPMTSTTTATMATTTSAPATTTPATKSIGLSSTSNANLVLDTNISVSPAPISSSNLTPAAVPPNLDLSSLFGTTSSSTNSSSSGDNKQKSLSQPFATPGISSSPNNTSTNSSTTTTSAAPNVSTTASTSALPADIFAFLEQNPPPANTIPTSTSNIPATSASTSSTKQAKPNNNGNNNSLPSTTLPQDNSLGISEVTPSTSNPGENKSTANTNPTNTGGVGSPSIITDPLNSGSGAPLDFEALLASFPDENNSNNNNNNKSGDNSINVTKTPSLSGLGQDSGNILPSAVDAINALDMDDFLKSLGNNPSDPSTS